MAAAAARDLRRSSSVDAENDEKEEKDEKDEKMADNEPGEEPEKTDRPKMSLASLIHSKVGSLLRWEQHSCRLKVDFFSNF